MIELFNPEAFTATGITLRNNSFGSYADQHKTLFWINRIVVIDDSPKLHSITNVFCESSVINLIDFGGFNEQAAETVT